MALFDLPGGGIRLENNNGTVNFDTSAPPIRLLPASALTPIVSVTFPDVQKGNAYRHLLYTSVVGGITISQAVCDSFTTMTGEERGPGRAINDGQTFLGTVPTGTNYLDCRCYVTRTAAPASTILNQTIAVRPAQGVWLNMPDGTMLLERSFPLARMIEVVLSGTSVYLNRIQSVQQGNGGGGAFMPWIPSNLEFNGGGGKNNGWLYSGTNGVYGIPVAVAQQKNASGGVNKNRSGADRCSLTDPTNYASTYSIGFNITPGVIS